MEEGSIEDPETGDSQSVLSERNDDTTDRTPVINEETETSTQSCLSMRSDGSMERPPYMSETTPLRKKKGPASSTPSCLSMRSGESMDHPPNMSETPPLSDPMELDDQSRCAVCEEILRDPVSILCGHWFCRQCVGSFQDQPGPSGDYACPLCGKKCRADDEPPDQSKEVSVSKVQKQMKASLKEKSVFLQEIGGEMKTLLDEVFTEFHVTVGESWVGNEEHEIRQLENTIRRTPTELSLHCNDIFKLLPGQETDTKLVMTMGVAGIGKTVAVQKFTLDWAEERANQNIDLVFSLPFRELNLVKEQISFHDLLTTFHPNLKGVKPKHYAELTILIILDGLDESRFPLNFQNNQVVTDMAEVTSVDVLFTNLIKRNLLPSALLWITSRPAAANQIPPECVDVVTELRGFKNPQKERYFRKKFSYDDNLASRVISHIRSSPSLNSMCYIPVFCWISSELLKETFRGDDKAEIPQTLTEMIAQFLFIQTKQRDTKYKSKVQKNTQKLLQSHREFLLILGKLAFKHLEKSNLIFYEEDLRNSGLDVTEASVKSGFFSSILKEESLFYQKKVFCFVHLIIQEFFAALYVFDCFSTKNTKPLQSFLKLKTEGSHKDLSLHELLKATVDRALESKNGHLDLFLRFLLGLSLEANRKFLTGLLTPTDPETPKKVLTYLKAIRRKGLSPERCINLFQCMVEMRDVAVKNEIQEYLESKTRSETELSPVLCSALAYMLLVSEDHLGEFDLKNYNTTQAGRERLIPAVRCCRKARLSRCQLNESSMKNLALALQFPDSPLRKLYLNNNDLRDSGIELLSAGLQSSFCRLETLKLSGCLVTEKGCAYLASALRSNPSHLRELDLSYNHPGQAGVKLLSDLKDNPNFKLEMLNVDNNGCKFLKPGLKKYACDLTLDQNTADGHLSLSEENRKVTWRREEQPYPDPSEGSDQWKQVLCREGLTQQRCYWEVEVTEPFSIGVTSRPSSSRGKDSDGRLGRNEFSWSLSCSNEGCFVWHNSEKVPISSYCFRGSRVGVYLDGPCSTVSFYRVTSDTMNLLHIYREKFTEPLYPGFELTRLSTVSICKMA